MDVKRFIFENRKLIFLNIVISTIVSIALIYLLGYYIYTSINYDKLMPIYYPNGGHIFSFSIFFSESFSIALIFQSLWIFVWAINILIYFKLLKNYKNKIRKSVTTLFVLSFLFAGMVPIILGIVALIYMKENNRRDYILWVYEDKNSKLSKKENKKLAKKIESEYTEKNQSFHKEFLNND